VSQDDFAFEPVRGLPEHLPDGEKLLWQGAPAWPSLARRAFHTDLVAAYFGLLAIWAVVSGLADGRTAAEIATAVAWLVPPAVAAVGVLALMAWATARSTVYTITSRRVVLRYGVALPLTINVPFGVIDSAALKIDANGTGDLPLKLVAPNKIAYLHLWPHVRPWHVSQPQPMLRAVPNAAAVARTLATALEANRGLTEADRQPAAVKATDFRPQAASARPPRRSQSVPDAVVAA
jgi:hypothetical protein